MPEVTTDSDLKQRVVELESERDEYKRLYVSMMEAYRKLEAGLVGQKREPHVPTSEQLTMDVVSMLGFTRFRGRLVKPPDSFVR